MCLESWRRRSKGKEEKKPTAVLQFDFEYPNLDSDFTNRNKKKELIDCGAMARLNTREQQLQRSKPVNYSIERIKQINKERHKIPVSSAVISPFLVTFMLQEGGKIIMAVVHLTRKLPTTTTLNTVINLQSEPVTFLSSSVWAQQEKLVTCERQPSDFLAAPFRQYKQVLFGWQWKCLRPPVLCSFNLENNLNIKTRRLQLRTFFIFCLIIFTLPGNTSNSLFGLISSSKQRS